LKFINYSVQTCIAATLLFLSPMVFAQGFGAVMRFGVTEIPTLSSLTLIIMALLLAAISYRIISKGGNNKNHTMIVSVITIGFVSFGYGSIKLINDAYAGLAIQPLVNSQVNVVYGVDVQYRNDTGGATVINSITPNADATACAPLEPITDPDIAVRSELRIAFPALPRCSVGLTLGAGQSCYLTCLSPAS
jgi:hypothetical protein